MLAGGVLLTAVLLAGAVVWQMRRALGGRRGTQNGALLVMALGGPWFALEYSHRQQPPPPEDQTGSPPIPSQACAKCHEPHYTSWRRTFHRTMTREATEEYVKGPFDGTPHTHLGLTARMIREGEQFFLQIEADQPVNPSSRPDPPVDPAGPGPQRRLSVDRLVGSHWFQQLLHRDEHGRYLRLPMAYHIVEGQWIHINNAFLAPDTDSYYSKLAVWNESCVFCHNTRPIKNPVPLGDSAPGAIPGYRTQVAELGISCEACHGAGETHVRAHSNPARRIAQRYSGEPDPTIVNPAKLSVKRSVDVCARCHGGPIPRFEAWNQYTYADPFLAGRDLSRFWYLAWSEEEMRRHAQSQGVKLLSGQGVGSQMLDGRFWGDGTPLTTAVEYQAMTMSACYEKGQGRMTCLTCHSMHDSDPNHQVKAGMRTNAACYSCHETYRERLWEHTHHAADSTGSLCHNCHMPHQVYSMLDTRRSHRIANPRIRDSLGTGKPHACNLCHLDKSLGWTQDYLTRWYGTKPEPLSDDEKNLASSLIHLASSDARSRAIVAGAFGWTPAQEASGRDWPVLVLTRTLEHERFPAVRYLAHRSLRSLHGQQASAYNYQGTMAERAAQLSVLRQQLEPAARPDPNRYSHLPFTATGAFADDVFDRLRRHRKDPDVFVNE